MDGFTEIKTCDICEGKGWIMVEKRHYKKITLRDEAPKSVFAGACNTVYNCTCKNEYIPNAKNYREAGINLGTYEKDYAGKYMARRSA
ncbi:hypothetical protein GC105_10630 [Alkalibaculum sp. M08DMB]|uniref:Uncharacterized protein n=1 Tax=Alkalibaculum sporogenes TaxID=2655001 RepID=A0A6A7KB47_9FIRM|nr:hypothetical protein [Alkalibaculum sporogenes]MPW26243.1 hypothetical protein [Alkalibaculum sporogenes]